MKSKVKFVKNDGILYRIYRDGPYVDPIEQVCVPEILVEKVIEMAHESLLSGHQGIARTTNRILAEFYFPQLNDRVKRFMRSCDLCQRCSSKKKVGGIVPLQSMPIASNAFDVVYIDIVSV